VYKTRTRGKLSIRASLLLHPTIGSPKLSKHPEGPRRPSKSCLFKPLWKRQKLLSFTGPKRIPACSTGNQNKHCAKECRFYCNNMEKKFWVIKVHTGKMRKFAVVSSQICIMRYVQRKLLLSTLVCFVPFVGHALWEIYKKRVDSCHYYNIVLIFHARYIKLWKKPKI